MCGDDDGLSEKNVSVFVSVNYRVNFFFYLNSFILAAPIETMVEVKTFLFLLKESLETSWDERHDLLKYL